MLFCLAVDCCFLSLSVIPCVDITICGLLHLMDPWAVFSFYLLRTMLLCTSLGKTCSGCTSSFPMGKYVRFLLHFSPRCLSPFNVLYILPGLLSAFTHENISGSFVCLVCFDAFSVPRTKSRTWWMLNGCWMDEPTNE